MSIGLFRAFVNLLMLTGPLFILQVYDRVLTSRSEATLVALAGIAAYLFLVMGLLDHFRARVLTRAGARLQVRLDAASGRDPDPPGRSAAARSAPATGLHDLDAMQRFASVTGTLRILRCALDAGLPGRAVHILDAGPLALSSGLLLLALAFLARTVRLQAEAGEASARTPISSKR